MNLPLQSLGKGSNWNPHTMEERACQSQAGQAWPCAQEVILLESLQDTLEGPVSNN